MLLRWFVQPLLLSLLAASFGTTAEPISTEYQGYDRHAYTVATAGVAPAEELRQDDVAPPAVSAPAPRGVPARMPSPAKLEAATSRADVGYLSRAPPTGLP